MKKSFFSIFLISATLFLGCNHAYKNFENKLLDNEISEDSIINLFIKPYTNKINKSEGKINWNISAGQILGLINGLSPTPGAWFINKGERYKILKAELGNLNGEPGIVLTENLEIGCKEKSIKILEIQREGKKVQKSGEFLLGSRITKGSNLSNV